MTYPNGITLDDDFTGGVLPTGWTLTRASTATDSFFTDAAGSSFNTLGNNIPRFAGANGIVVETQARTNLLLNSGAPANQTTGSIAVGNACLWVIGTGSATVAAGTGVATGLGTANAGTPLIFNVTTAGTFTVNIAGSLTRFQLERGGSPTSYIPTTATTATRTAETLTKPIGAWFNAAAGTLLAQGTLPLVNANTATQGWIELDDGTANNRIMLAESPNGTMTVTVAGSNTSNVGVTGSGIVANTPQRVAGRYSSVDCRVSSQGIIANAQVGVSLPSGITRLSVPLGTASATVLGTTIRLQRVQYWPFAMIDADLQASTNNPPQAQVTSTGRGTSFGRAVSTSLVTVPLTAYGFGFSSGGRVKTSFVAPPPVYDTSLGVYDLALNRLDHDMVFTNTQITDYEIWPINGADKVAQEIKMTLLAFLGEWFLDTTFGVPYLEEILVKNPRMSTVESILRSHILDVPHVLLIDWLTLGWDRENRKLNVEFQAETDYGPIQESYKLEVPRV